MSDETAAETTEETASEEAAAAETASTETTAAPSVDDWRAPIEDKELRKVADRFASPADMAKAVSDLRKRESTSIRLPGKDASDEDVAAYKAAIGVPENVDGYEFALPEGREATDDDKAFQSAAGEVFHKLNISAEQATGLNAWWNEFQAQAEAAQTEADKAFAAETEAALRKEWPGQEFDRNKVFADRAATELFGDTIEQVREIETKDGKFVLDHPALVKVLARVGREMDEGKLGSVISEGDRDAIDTQIADLDKKIEVAQRSGDRETANRLYQQQLALTQKIVGNQGIVGAEGRAA